MVNKSNYIGVDAIIERMHTTPSKVCDGLLFAIAHEKWLQPEKIEHLIETKYPSKYDCEDSIEANCERVFGKELTEQIEYSLHYGGGR